MKELAEFQVDYLKIGMKQVILQDKIDKIEFDDLRMQINMCVQQAKSVDFMFKTKGVEEENFNYNLVRLENSEKDKDLSNEINRIVN